MVFETLDRLMADRAFRRISSARATFKITHNFINVVSDSDTTEPFRPLLPKLQPADQLWQLSEPLAYLALVATHILTIQFSQLETTRRAVGGLMA